MTVISTTKDPGRRTLALVAEFDAFPERVSQVWAPLCQAARREPISRASATIAV